MPQTDRNSTRDNWQKLEQIDADNQRFLKRILPDEGWFRLSEHDSNFVGGAFLIVQHSGDLELMENTIKAMEALPDNEIAKPDYALLKDRILMQRGEKQIFGSQLTCVNGKFGFHPIVEPDGVDERRASVGLEPLNVYQQLFPNYGQSC